MSVLALLAGQTPSPPAAPAGLGLREALMPSLEIQETFVATPGTAVAVRDEIVAYKQAQSGPARERLTELILEPGEYDVAIIEQNMTITRSSTGVPEDVIVAPPGTRGGVLHWFGGPTWIRGITFRSTTEEGVVGSKYPLHVTGGSTLTVIDCNFEAFNANSDGGPACIGLDAGDGLHWSMVGCKFANLGGILGNIHGAGIGPLGQDIVFYDCEVVSEGTATSIGFEGSADERTDIYFIGGNITPGFMSPHVGVHTDGWPAPVGGFTNYERISMGLDYPF